MSKRSVLIILAAAQFLMVLDQSVMNVSISQLVEDFHTTVTTIQAVITLYSLTMAALMMTGGRLGDILGRRRAFSIGLVIYGAGSLLTALSWSIPTLALGWSLLEGIGAALVLPALVALTASNFEGKARVAAYGVLGGVAGAGIAVGPILGGWVTTNLTWRLIFGGEVVLVIAILLGTRKLTDEPTERSSGGLDWVGSVLSALGLALIVFGVLQSSNWGWLEPRNSPITPLGFSLVPFVIAAGAVVLAGFRAWERRRERVGDEPLVQLGLFRIATLRSALGMFMAQNAILLGIFFAVPLYLQVVQGYDAFKTGVQMLPVSIAMLVVATLASRYGGRWSARTIVRVGLGVLLVATVVLISTIDPQINTASFAVAMAAIGVGMGLIVSQLANAAQSSVGDDERSEAAGLQYTAQQMGAALGTALVGAVLITGLLSSFSSNVSTDPRISDEVNQQVGMRLEGNVSFVDADQVRTAATDAGIDTATTDAIVEGYEDSQLKALKTALLAAGFIVLAAFFTTGGLPSRPVDATPEASGEAEASASA